MKILIIGSEGYVGSLLCLKLSARHEVLCVDRQLGGERMSTVVPDDVEVVVDLAAHAHDPSIDPEAVFQNNAFEPRLFFEQLPARCYHYIIPSSLSVFAARGSGAYPASKRTLERLMLTCDDYPARVSIPRFGTLFGATRRASWRRHLLLNSMVYDAVHEGVVHVNGAAIRRPVVSLDDAVEVLIRLVENVDQPRGEIRNIWSTSGTLQEYGEFVADLTGARVALPVDFPVHAPTDKRDYGWGAFAPKRIEGAVRRLIEWVRRGQV